MTEPKVVEVRGWDAPPEPDGVVATPPEMLAELARLRRIDNPGNLYQVSNLTIDSQGQARLFPIDAFDKLSLAEAFVSERAKEGRSQGLVILAVAARVARKLGELP